MNKPGPRSKILASAAFLLSFLLFFCCCDSSSYRFVPESTHWMQFRGPGGSGIAPESADPPIHFNADSNVLWLTPILPGWSSPCIVNDRIFLTGFNKKDSLVHTYAIDREMGEILWQDSTNMWWVYDLHPANSYANPTIASDGKRIFVHHPAKGVITYDLDGNKLWEFLHWGLTFTMASASSPQVMDSVLLVTMNYRENPRIVMLDCASGDSVGVIQNSEHMQSFAGRSSTPVVHEDLLILHQQMKLAAYHIPSGEAVWWLETPAVGVSTPVVHDNVVYAGTFTNFGEASVNRFSYDLKELLERYDLNDNEKLEREEVPDSLMLYERIDSEKQLQMDMQLNDERSFGFMDSNQDGGVDAGEWSRIEAFLEPYYNHGMLALPTHIKGELSQADLLWKVQENSPETPSPLVAGPVVFFIKNGGIMSAIERESGKVLFTGRIGAPGPYLSSPMLAGGRIYTCSYNGTVSVLSAEDFSVLANNKLKEKIGASPVAVDDVLYVRTNRHLYAFRD